MLSTTMIATSRPRDAATASSLARLRPARASFASAGALVARYCAASPPVKPVAPSRVMSNDREVVTNHYCRGGLANDSFTVKSVIADSGRSMLAQIGELLFKLNPKGLQPRPVRFRKHGEYWTRLRRGNGHVGHEDNVSKPESKVHHSSTKVVAQEIRLAVPKSFRGLDEVCKDKCRPPRWTALAFRWQHDQRATP